MKPLLTKRMKDKSKGLLIPAASLFNLSFGPPDLSTDDLEIKPNIFSTNNGLISTVIH
jgi:hypothetical protein